MKFVRSSQFWLQMKIKLMRKILLVRQGNEKVVEAPNHLDPLPHLNHLNKKERVVRERRIKRRKRRRSLREKTERQKNLNQKKKRRNWKSCQWWRSKVNMISSHCSVQIAEWALRRNTRLNVRNLRRVVPLQLRQRCRSLRKKCNYIQFQGMMWW